MKTVNEVAQNILAVLGGIALIVAAAALHDDPAAPACPLDQIDHTLRIQIEPAEFRCSGPCGEMMPFRSPRVYVPTGQSSFAAYCVWCAPKQPR